MRLTAIGVDGAYPKKNGATSSYLIQEKDTNVLLDFGSGAMAKVQNYIDICAIDAIIISHFHADHMSDMLVLMYYLSLNKLGKLKVYMPLSDSPFFYILKNCDNFDITIIKEQEYKIKDLSLTFYELKHIEKTFGMKVCNGKSVLAYTADTVMCENLNAVLKGSNAAICDCATFSDSPMHIKTLDILELCKRHNVKSYISHITYEDIAMYKKHAKEYNCEILRGGDVYEFI